VDFFSPLHDFHDEFLGVSVFFLVLSDIEELGRGFSLVFFVVPWMFFFSFLVPLRV